MGMSTANATPSCCGVQDSVQLVPCGVELISTVIYRLIQLSHQDSGILVMHYSGKKNMPCD